MTYETGTATDLEDLYSKLDTFAVTTHGGWARGYSPNPDTTNRWFELSKGSLSFSSRYPSSIGSSGSISIHQATAFINTSTAPGDHTNDSGNGYNTASGGTSANFETERCVRAIGDGPFPSYHFFADDTGSKDYIHCVVEAQTGLFRHFGFGLLNKFGDWTGGEYVYGHYQDTQTTSTAVTATHQTLLDGLGATAERLRAGTVRVEGLPNQDGSGRWGVAVALANTSIGNDSAGNERAQIHGTFRSSIEARGFGNPIGNFSSGVVSMYSIGAYYRDPDNPRAYLLGYMDDVRALNIRNFAPGDEVVVGTDTWVMFPMSLKTTALVANRSLNSGIAYKKVV